MFSAGTPLALRYSITARARRRDRSIDQAIAAVVGMAIELNAIDAWVGLEKAEDDIELGPGHWFEVHPAPRKAHLAATHLVEVHRQQFGGAGEVVVIGLVESGRQQTHLDGFAALGGAVAQQWAAAFEQAGQQACALLLGAVEQHLGGANADRAQIDIAAPGLPRCGGRQQGRRPRPQPAFAGLHTEGHLLPRPTHKYPGAEIGNGLAQAAFELVALDLPLDLLQAGLETNGQHWLACQQAKQDEWITAHDRLPGIRLTFGLSVPEGKT